MQVIPSIDLRAGRVVRLEQGDYSRESVYDDRPDEVARGFEAAGATRLHVVDLDGARDGSDQNLSLIEEIRKAAPGLALQTGGGVRDLAGVTRRFDLGADRVVIGTAAIEEPALLEAAAARYPEGIVLGLDARSGQVATRGWRETASASVEEVLERFSDLALAAVLHTDIERDGLLTGPNVASTAALASRSRFPVLASGGVSSIADLEELARARVIAGVIVGRALYTGDVDLREALLRVAAC